MSPASYQQAVVPGLVLASRFGSHTSLFTLHLTLADTIQLTGFRIVGVLIERPMPLLSHTHHPLQNGNALRREDTRLKVGRIRGDSVYNA